MQVAAQHSETVSKGSRISVEEGLLLDGIALHAANVSPGHIELAALVVADLADSGLALKNRTAMPAGEATDAMVVDFLVQISFANIFIHDIAKGRHELPIGVEERTYCWLVGAA